jgi:UDP-3-O-[3-hydroxymyristoyl] glucosamine N-acyltransferase
LTATTLGEIHAALGGEAVARLAGPADLPIARIAPLHAAGPDAITFIAQARLAVQLQSTAAGCVIVAPALAEAAQARGAALVTDNPYRYYAALTRWWAARSRIAPVDGVHPSACVAPGVVMGRGVSIGPMSVVEAGVHLGDGVQIGSHCHLGHGVVLGEATRLAPRVTLMHGTRVGARGYFNSGAVIGADGFGFAAGPQGWEKIEQFGGVWIGDDVDIGANTCVDRGALEDTVIEDGVKLDNQIQIAHNVRVGARSAMAGCVGVAGSTKIGRECTFGGAAMILGHLEIADRVNISAASVVMRSIRQPGTYSGIFPLDDNAAWEKNAATLRQLHTLRDRLRALEKKLA